MTHRTRRDVLKASAGTAVLTGGGSTAGGAVSDDASGVTYADIASRDPDALPVTETPEGWTSSAGNTSYIEDGHKFDSDRLEIAWTFEAGSGGIAVANDTGTVYIGRDDGVVALNADDGSVEWRNGDVSGDQPTVTDDTVYVSGSEIVALDRTDGSVRWQTDFGSETVSAPTVAYGAVYATAEAGETDTLYALEADDGSVRWRKTRSINPDESWNDGFASMPAAANGFVYVAVDQEGQPATSVVFALDPVTGEEVERIGGRRNLGGSLAVNATAVAASGTIEYTHIYDAQTGEQFAQPFGTAAALGDDVAVTAHETEGMEARSLESGELLWEGASRTSAPVIAGDTVYVYYTPHYRLDPGRIIASDKNDGTTKWEFELDYPDGRPGLAISDETIYVAGNGPLMALRETADSENGGSDEGDDSEAEDPEPETGSDESEDADTGSSADDSDGSDGSDDPVDADDSDDPSEADGGESDDASDSSNDDSSSDASDPESESESTVETESPTETESVETDDDAGGDSAGSSDRPNGSENGSETEPSGNESATETDETPGFGVLSGLVGTAGGAVLAARRLASSDADRPNDD